MYAHLGNILLITWPLNMDSEHSKFILKKEHIYIIISLSSPTAFVNIKEQKFTGSTLAIVVVRGLESERVL